MSRLEIRPAAVIAQLKDLLRDRYRRDGSELPLLKEIVQNADDAGATGLDLVVLEDGVLGASNPLLRGPALACINDGRFTPEDQTAISSFGLTSKAEERSSIGRFGVGQKSVFHLSEAFFFVARPSVDEAIRADVIDPWATSQGDQERPEWNEFSPADQERVAVALERWLRGPSWFVLYLPLRTEEHRRAHGKEITSHHPDVKRLEAELAEDVEIPCLLPQLANLRRISSWRMAGPTTGAAPLGEAVVAPDSSRLSRPTEEPFARGFRGAVAVSQRGGPPQRLAFVGSERCVGDDVNLAALPNDRQWPRRTIETRDGEMKDVPEKTRAHGAVTWMRTPARRGELRMSWAVFLPLSMDPEIVPGDGLDAGWRVLLHGYFFPDSGRRALGVSAPPATAPAGATENPPRGEEIHTRWNELLRDRATLPSLLPALEEALRECDDEEGERLAQAVARAPLWHAHRAAATASGVLAWGPVFGPDGALRSAPRRLSASTALLPVPRPSREALAKVGDLLRCWMTAERGGGAAVVWDDGPPLGQRGAWDVWDAPRAATALDAIEPRLLGDPTALQLLVQTATGMQGVVLGRPLVAMLRRAFRASVLNSGAGADAWKALVRLVPRGAIMWSGARVGLLRDLARLETEVLLLPDALAPQESTRFSPVVARPDAQRILRRLAESVEQSTSGEDKLIAEVVSAVGVRTVLDDPELRELALFRVWSARRAKHVCVNAAALRSTVDRGAAFRKKGLSAPEDLARKIASAIPALDDVLLVDDEGIADAMGVSVLDERMLKTLLLQDGTVLGGDEERRDLLATLLGTRRSSFGLPDLEAAVLRDPDVRLAVRFLIHGDAAHLRDDLALLFPREDSDPDGADLASAIFAATGDAWRIVPRRLGVDLSNRWMEALGVMTLSSATLIETLERAPADHRSSVGSHLSREQRERLRRVLADARADALFATLSIHDTSDGRVVAPGEAGVYLEDSWPVPEPLRPHVHLVSLAPEPSIREAQRRAIRPVWSPVEQIGLCLGVDEPACYAREILDGLAGAGTLPTEIAQASKAQRWLMTVGGTAAKPEDILDVPPEVDRTLRLLLPSGGRVFHAPSQILERLRTHPAFQRVLTELALRSTSAFAAVGQELESPGAGVAAGTNLFWIMASGSRDRDRSFLERGIAVAALDSDPAWHLVKDLSRAYGEHFFEVVSPLLDTFRLSPSADRAVALLERFTQDRGLDASEQARSRALFADYLRACRARPDFEGAILPRIHLLNANETWRRTAELARSESNLQPRYQLLQAHRVIVGSLAPLPVDAAALTPAQEEVRNRRGAEASGGEVLAEYFARWSGRVSPEAIGYLLACLGDGPQRRIGSLAERYLGASATLEGARERIFFALSAREVGFERTRAVRARWALAVVEDGATIEVTSLAGAPLRASVAGAELATLFVGDVPAAGDAQPAWLRLRRVDPAAYGTAELHAAVGASLVSLVGASVGLELDRARFDAFWRSLGRGGQSQVAAVRNRILQQLPGYVDMLVGRRDPLFGDVCRRLDHAEQRVQEVIAENSGLWDAARNKEVEARDATLKELRDLVLTEPRAHERLLRGVRQKLASYQYTPEQVLFELFQNADDATRDLADLAAPTDEVQKATSKGFLVAIDRVSPAICVQHWGRAINRGDVSTGAQRSPRGYELDLKNMLVLHLSDKDELSTGRFGLGFKSIHLLTSRPRVRSGDLSFEILGGLVPKHLPLEGPPDLSTTIEIPLEDSTLLRCALARFVPCAGVLVAFARAIRHVTLEDGGRREIGWDPAPIPGAQGVEVGDMGSLGTGGGVPTRALVLRADQLAIAIRIGARGVERFMGLPEIWCTAPTTADWGLGYCINAPFVLDVGRGQLASTAPENLTLFARLGALLGDALGSLAEALETRFEDSVLALGLEVGARTAAEVRAAFWRSVFDQLTAVSFAHGAPDRLRLVRAMHGPGTGLAALIARHRVLPTGLPSVHDVLTTTEDVRWVMDEVTSRPVVFSALRGVAPQLASISPGSAVAHDVQTRLAGLGLAVGARAATLTFEDLVAKALTDATVVSPELALACAQLRTVLEAAGLLNAQAVVHLREHLGRARFRTRSGKARRASEILLGKTHWAQLELVHHKKAQELSDELRRAEFAPDAYVLADDYAADLRVVELFLFARERREVADADQLATWARSASEDRRMAVVRYLATGELNDAVVEAVREQGGLGWCSEPVHLEPYVEELSRRDVEVLRVRLFDLTATLEPTEGSFDDDGDKDGEGPSGPEQNGFKPVGDPGTTLRNIADWWRERRSHWTMVYEQRVYNAVGGAQSLAQKLRSNHAQERREGWLLLLTLAACQRFGRQKPGQNAGFVQRLRTDGSPPWWHIVTADPKRTRPEAWTGILDQWLDATSDEDTYRMWLGSFPTLYQLHRHGEVYDRLLSRAHDHPPKQFTLETLLAPKANQVLTGAGGAFAAPPLGPALGIGASWALRELVRLDVVPKREHLAPFCYVPRRRTREFLARLGAAGMGEPFTGSHDDRSRLMFEFVRSHLEGDADFHSAFDLPLYLVETEPDAREEVKA